MAATKEAICIILDAGIGMKEETAAGSTFLETSIETINMILQRKMFAESKDEVGLVVFGTSETQNALSDGETYSNVCSIRSMSVVDWDLLDRVNTSIHCSNISSDFLDAIVVGMDLLVRGLQGKKGFCSKRVILFSNFTGNCNEECIGDISSGFQSQEIELNIIGPDLDAEDEDLDDGTPLNTSEAMAKELSDKVGGECYSFSEAIPALSYFQSRQVRPTPWKVNLEISSNLQIPVNGFIKTKEMKPKSWKQSYRDDPNVNIRVVTSYHLMDDEETEVESSDLVDGYRYGSTLVPFSADDKEVMKFRATKCFKVLGFTKSVNIKRHLLIGDNCMTFMADKDDAAAQIALSAIIRALDETNMVAIVRRVYSAAASPKLGVLFPHIKAKYECLYYNDLPFAEDLRRFQFPSLPLSDDISKFNKKSIPTEKQLQLADDLIETMNLQGVKNEATGSSDFLKPSLIFNPYLQRLYKSLQFRAINPLDNLPNLNDTITEHIDVPEEFKCRYDDIFEEMKSSFKLEYVNKRKADETGNDMFQLNFAENDKTDKKAKLDENLEGGLASLIKEEVKEVGTVTPIEDFKSILSCDPKMFLNAASMLCKAIDQIIRDSFGNMLYKKAIGCLKISREESIRFQNAEIFNNHLMDMKKSLPGIGHSDFWSNVVGEKISLISKVECESSPFSIHESDAFISNYEIPNNVKVEDEEDDLDDLFDQLE